MESQGTALLSRARSLERKSQAKLSLSIANLDL